MRNIQDWCISRQIWWGHRIPAWYDEQGNVFVARDEDQARAKAREHHGHDVPLTQDDGRAGHLVLLGPVAVLDPGLARADPGAGHLLPHQRPGHRIRHHLLLGRAHDHDGPQVHRRGPLPPGLHPRPGQATPTATRCPSPRAMSSTPWTSSTASDIESLVAKNTGGLMQPDMAQQVEQNTRTPVPRRHRRLRHGRPALYFRRSGFHRPRYPLRPGPHRGLPQLLQQAVERGPLRAAEHRGARHRHSTIKTWS